MTAVSNLLFARPSQLAPEQRSRSLALQAILWTALCIDVSFSTLVVPMVLGYTSERFTDPRWLLPTISIPIVTALLLLSRKKPEKAATILIGFTCIASWGFVIAQMRMVHDARELARGLLLVSLSQLFAGLFLSWKGILRISILNFTGLLTLPWIITGLNFREVVGNSILYVFILILTSIGAILHQADLYAIKKAQAERQSLEEQMHKGQKLEALGRLAGGVAHDFNNMLTTIFARIDAIRENALDRHIHHELDGIERSAEQAAGLIRRLLDHARARPMQCEAIAPDALLNETVNLVRPSIPSHIVLRSRCETDTPTLVGDASQLTQILVNLAVNARDALLESTPTTSDSTLPHRIELSARPATLEDFSNTTLEWKPDWVAIEVRDNGPGIPPEIVNHVFEPFFTTKSAGKGTGLGLWNCLGVVQSHGGTLALENLPRHGACFRILLPSHQTAPANFPEATDPELDTITPAKGRVLLVDDEESIREHASMALEADGWEVETAHDGEAALERFRNRTADFHLVVLDLSLPSLPGREVARQILSERPSQSILVMTGFDLGANEAEPEIPGTRGTLLKPFRMAKLVRECRKLLASAYA